jgi:hypothetical protein
VSHDVIPPCTDELAVRRETDAYRRETVESLRQIAAECILLADVAKRSNMTLDTGESIAYALDDAIKAVNAIHAEFMDLETPLDELEHDCGTVGAMRRDHRRQTERAKRLARFIAS